MTQPPDFAAIAARANANGIMVTAAGVEEIAGLLRLGDFYEALVQADLKIRSYPGADQSDVQFIRVVLGDSATAALVSTPACDCARRYDPDQFDHQAECATVAPEQSRSDHIADAGKMVPDGFVMVPRELREMSERAAAGPWEVDGDPNEDGEYGPGPDPGRGFDDFMITASRGGKILGTEGATHKSIEEEFDDEGYKTAWDQIGRDNAQFAAAAVNFVRDLLAASPSCPSSSPEIAAAWQRVADALNDIPNGMHAELEDAAGALDDLIASQPQKGEPA